MTTLRFDTPVDTIHPFVLKGIGPSLHTLIETAKEELGRKITTQSDGESSTWGFFPELNPSASEYPACVALQEWLDQHFLSLNMFQSLELQLAFIRLATSEPQSSFGGLHIDASAGIDHHPPKDRPAAHDGILRILINLYDEPRELQYCTETIARLREQGADIPPNHYKIVTLPENISLKSYYVKPRENETLHGIMFDSSSTLHAGQTNKKGHFLASYGGYAAKKAIADLLLKD